MFRSFLLTAFRNLKKTRLFSFVNILGLTVGMTCCLLILHYVHYEKSYDTFHKNADRIYRIRYEREDGTGGAVRFASCCPPAGALIRERYPDVEKLARLFSYKAAVSHGDIRFYEDRIFFADPEFVQMFDFPFLSGNPEKDLSQPGLAFISQSTAKKYFGDQDPIGQTFRIDLKSDYRVAGVFADIPDNSHVKFDFLLPLKNVEAMYGDEYMLAWGHTGMYTYALMKPGADLPAFAAKLSDLVEEQFGEALKEYNMTMTLPVQPLKDIHLDSHYMQEFEANGSRSAVNSLFVIALFIVFMAWVNYVNLSTARSVYRLREVGLRKVVGATQFQLAMQFLVETVFVNLLALVMTFGFILLLNPVFSRLTQMPAHPMIWSQSWFWGWSSLLLAAGIVLAGVYPILALTSFKIAHILKGPSGFAPQKFNLRRTLMVFQFAMALILIVSMSVVTGQLHFMRNQNPGFQKDQILALKSPRVRPDNTEEVFKQFKETVRTLPGVQKICHVTETPGRQIYWDAGGIKREGEPDSQGKNYQIVGIDYDFVDVFGLKFAAGRNFSENFPSDTKGLILNETAVRWMGFDSPESALNQRVDYWGEIFTIVGVLKDFHQQSFKEAFEPHLYRFMPSGRGSRGQFAVQVSGAQMNQTIQQIQQIYADFFHGNPFDYFFLDEYYQQQYRADELFGRVIGLFTILTLFITSLGLFGLSTFSVAQRTREIGIRKTLGASIAGLLLLLVKEYLKWILIALAVAWPVSWFVMHRWLENFAFHIPVGIGSFLFSLILTVLVSMLTVGYQTVRAALANPVESLRYE